MPIEAASASRAIMGTRDRARARVLENFMTGFLTRTFGLSSAGVLTALPPTRHWKVALIVGIG
jgi:hypothetical protein